MKYPVLSLLVAFAMPSFADDVRSGGATTTFKQGANAFSQPASNLPLSERIDFSVGNSFFRNPWVSAPASTDARDGLGPLFNTNGCQNCHIKDGRGHLPETGDDNAVSMLIRLSIPAMTAEQQKQLIMDGNIPEPNYGGQLQDFALPGVEPEAKVNIHFETHVETFADGTEVTLRKPIIVLSDLYYGDMHPDTEMSLRIAPPMIGLGLLEAVSASQLTAIAEKQTKANQGISGRANRVWDIEKKASVIGRFGWKAGQPTLMQQNAAAFNGDLGLTSHLFSVENCTSSQSSCDTLPNGGKPEVSEKILNFVEFYSQHLAVPARRNIDDPQVMAGETLFVEANCGSCHQASLKTASIEGRPALSNQTIHPYTDLLLHDMGEGLADNRSEFIANGQEWRTAPLWGLGYTQEVNGHTHYLHDGRARNALEAVLWHGGEAKASKQRVLKMNKQEREALVAFLHSL
ncbi:di-heme oxidoredictase family protein [Enterovibrio norvegicus]|uniref:Thiol oxidoreductase n=1 Tax=Enterovibrio norvegicus TaxID=188144 RepID=A0A2N7L4U5_9GAMM|nr:di-heme oxidoredictase family protein [Enterovibrio norvegicus]PMN88399.1 thiol oxidoreductase [Enterovibrio norvegicus]